MGSIDFEITSNKFDEISPDFYAKRTAKNLVENPFDFYEEKGENLHWYFGVFFVLLIGGISSLLLPVFAAIIVALIPSFYLGKWTAKPFRFLANLPNRIKVKRIAAEIKQPIFITALSSDDPTVYERYLFAQGVIEGVWGNVEHLPRPGVFYFPPGDEGRCWEEYRDWVDETKVTEFKAYHRKIKTTNPEYYEAITLNQNSRPWQKVKV